MSVNYVFVVDDVLIPKTKTLKKFIYNRYTRFLNILEKPKLSDSVNDRVNYEYLDDLLKINDQRNKNLIYNSFSTSSEIFSMKPTDFARRTIMNSNFIDHNVINDIYLIIRREWSVDINLYIYDLCKKYFKGRKIHIIFQGDREMSEVLKDIKWTVLITNLSDDMYSFLGKDFNIERKEFLIFKSSFDNKDVLKNTIIQEKGGIVSYIDI